MDNNLKPYEKYRNVDALWLYEIPFHWNCEKLGMRFIERRTKVSDQDFAPLSVTKNGIVPQLSTAAKTNDGDNRKLVKSGDFGINSRSDRKGSSGLSIYNGSVSLINIVLKPVDISPKYSHYLLKSYGFIEEFYRNGRGIVADLWTTRYCDMRNINIPLPPREEQDQIVRYLDWKLAKINKFIKAKKKQIELLKEQKQAIINKAVTKGLDPNAKMKPSGVEWLGDIPEKWNIKPLKYFVGSNVETLTENFEKESMINYIDISTVGFGELRQKPVTYSFKDAPSRARRIIHCGDTIISTVRTYLKSMCYIDTELDGYIASTGFAVLTPKESVYPKLLNYILSADYFVDRVSRDSIGVSYPAITEKRLTDLKIALPNSLAEQENILEYIEKVTEGINSAISIMQKEIELLSEYRTSLISDVVTGKVDVRHIEVNDTVECIEEIFEDLNESVEFDMEVE